MKQEFEPYDNLIMKQDTLNGMKYVGVNVDQM